MSKLLICTIIFFFIGSIICKKSIVAQDTNEYLYSIDCIDTTKYRTLSLPVFIDSLHMMMLINQDGTPNNKFFDWEFEGDTVIFDTLHFKYFKGAFGKIVFEDNVMVFDVTYSVLNSDEPIEIKVHQIYCQGNVTRHQTHSIISFHKLLSVPPGYSIMETVIGDTDSIYVVFRSWSRLPDGSLFLHRFESGLHNIPSFPARMFSPINFTRENYSTENKYLKALIVKPEYKIEEIAWEQIIQIDEPIDIDTAFLKMIIKGQIQYLLLDRNSKLRSKMRLHPSYSPTPPPIMLLGKTTETETEISVLAMFILRSHIEHETMFEFESITYNKENYKIIKQETVGLIGIENGRLVNIEY